MVVPATDKEITVKINELLARATDSLEAKIVFAEPVEKDGITVIAAARVVGGGGGGSGMDQRGQQGEGGGLGLVARPVGAYVIKNGELRWEPALDVNRVVATIGAVAITALLVAGRVLRGHLRARRSL
jgi:uncharacterized spore protein YtfJ